MIPTSVVYLAATCYVASVLIWRVVCGGARPGVFAVSGFLFVLCFLCEGLSIARDCRSQS